MEWKMLKLNYNSKPKKFLKLPVEEGLTIMRPLSFQWRVLKVNFVFQDARVTGLESGIRNVTDKQTKKGISDVCHPGLSHN